MKIRTKSLAFALFVFLIAFCFSCGQPKSDWNGTIEQVDGVTVVKNPIEPMYGEDVLELEEELSIGEAEGREKYMFSGISMIALDAEDNIYIPDADSAEIRVFDKKGKFLRAIGKKGEGPGEFQSPRSIQITPQNEIMVVDFRNRRISFFSLDGSFLKGINTGNFNAVISPKMDSQGNIFGNVLLSSFKYSLQKFDAELNPEGEIYVSEIFNQSRSGELQLMRGLLCFDLFSAGGLICGFTRQYELLQFGADGDLKKKIQKEYEAREISEEFKEYYIDRLTRGEGFPPEMKVKFPQHHSPFTSISCDEKGRVFVCTGIPVPDSKRTYYFDIFGQEGKYIARIPFETMEETYPLYWKNGRLYVITADDDDYQYVKRFRAAWKI